MYAEYTILADGVLFNDTKIYNSESISSKKIKHITYDNSKDDNNKDNKNIKIKTNLKKKEIINDDNYLFLFYC